jgi:1-acyl-sn-glycerol-3-phosphate acyltransferase
MQATIRCLARLWCRLELVHPERIPATGPFLVAATHTSHLDPMLIGSFIRREVYFIAREGVLRAPVVGAVCRGLNTLSIRRGESDRAALRACREVMQRGWPLVFFPEGTRSTDGRLGPIQPGWVMVMDGIEGLPYLPVVCQDTFNVMPRGGLFPRPAKVRIHFGEPRTLPARQPGERAREYYARCCRQLETDLREIGAK